MLLVFRNLCLVAVVIPNHCEEECLGLIRAWLRQHHIPYHLNDIVTILKQIGLDLIFIFFDAWHEFIVFSILFQSDNCAPGHPFARY